MRTVQSGETYPYWWLCRYTPCGIPEFRELWELWEEMWLCRYTPCGIPEFREFWEEMLYHWALWNSGIPGIMGFLGRDVISLVPLDFRNYGNSGKRCYITRNDRFNIKC